MTQNEYWCKRHDQLRQILKNQPIRPAGRSQLQKRGTLAGTQAPLVPNGASVITLLRDHSTSRSVTTVSRLPFDADTPPRDGEFATRRLAWHVTAAPYSEAYHSTSALPGSNLHAGMAC